MRIRAKISFMAFTRRLTIHELFISTITNCYRKLMMLGDIPQLTEERIEAEIKVYKKLVTKGIRGSFMNICDFNWPNLIKGDREIIAPKIDFIKRRQDLRDKCGAADKFSENVANKNGEVKTVSDDPDLLTKLAKLITRLHDRGSCIEMFRDFMTVHDSAMVKIDYSRFYKMKLQREDILWTYNVLNQAIKLKGLSGFALHRAILERIKLSKEMFMLEIQQGLEVAIPKDLSQDQYPKSFQYYDPILSII